VLLADQSTFARSLIAGMQETDYFHVLYHPTREDEARALLRRGDVQFVLAVPEGFSRKLVRGDFPAVLLEIDATDPAAASNALAAVNTLILDVLNRDLQGTLQRLQGRPPPFESRIHRHFNPEGLTRYNIVPGLMGAVLTIACHADGILFLSAFYFALGLHVSVPGHARMGPDPGGALAFDSLPASGTRDPAKGV